LLAKNVQCDFIDLANLPAYHLVFLPYPLSLSDHQIAVLRAWVESGGTLVSEGGFGYFDDLGRVRPDPRSRGFGDFIDARPSAPSFAADMLNGLAFLAATEEPPVAVGGGLLREFYTLTETPPSRPGHEALVQPGGFYEDGSTAVIENDFGLGRIRLAGTMFGYSYHRNPTPATAAWIASALAFSGVEQRIRVDAPGIVARLWEDGARRYVWCVNRNNTQTEADVFPGPGLIPSGEGVVSIRGTACEWSREAVAVRVRIPARDAAIFELVDVTDLVAPVDLQA
jgi:beta-galactosidase